jgi:hypothetical protein
MKQVRLKILQEKKPLPIEKERYTFVSILVQTIHDLIVVSPLEFSNSASSGLCNALGVRWIVNERNPNVENIILWSDKSNPLAIR